MDRREFAKSLATASVAIACNGAFRNNSTIPIDFALFAADGSPVDIVLERQSRVLTAAPTSAVWASAFLAPLRRVYPEQANSLAMNFNGVAVDDAWNSDDLARFRQRRTRRQYQRGYQRSPKGAQAHRVSCSLLDTRAP